jgi:hypothetical protein
MDRHHLSNNGARRVSHFINRRPAVNIHHATRYAERIGVPLNRFVTINFTSGGCSAELAAQMLQKMISQRFAPWLRRTAKVRIPLSYVWTLEAAGNQMAAHLLVHMPSPLMKEFDARLREWLKGLFDVEHLDPSALHIRDVGNVVGVRRYMLKGIDPAWGPHLQVQPVPQGLVVGKRSGFSRNLGPEARRRGGYRPI